jgi:hypothetical protein
MQPLVAARTLAIPPAVADPAPAPATAPLSAMVRDTYTDAERIPQYAVNDVGIATQNNMVVNHPDPNVLNPNQPLRRATAAAFIHQTLVTQNRMEPLPEDANASNYIARPAINQAAR